MRRIVGAKQPDIAYNKVCSQQQFVILSESFSSGVSFFTLAETVSIQIVAPEVSQQVPEIGEVQPSPIHSDNDDTPQRASNIKKESWKDKVKKTFTVFFMKFVLGAIDIATDLSSAGNYIGGGFGLSLYFLADRDDPYNDRLYGAHLFWGVITLVLIWIPGLMNVMVIATEQEWRGIGCGQGMKRVVGYVFLIITWPLFSLLL